MENLCSPKTAVVAATFFTILFFGKNLSAATVESAQTGDWFTPATWVGGAVPLLGDDVIIKNGHIVTMSNLGTVVCASVAVEAGAELEIVNPSIGDPVAFTNNGTVDWQEGILETSGFDNNGTIDIGVGNLHALSGPVTNDGTINFSAGQVVDGNPVGSFTNSNGASIIFSSSNLWSVDIINHGTIKRTLSSGSITFQNMTLTNEADGLVEVTSGTSLVANPADFVINGEIIVNGTIDFWGGTNTIGATADIHGPGTVNLLFATAVNFNGEPLKLEVNEVWHSGQVGGTSAVEIPAGTTWYWHQQGEFLTTAGVTNYGYLNVSGVDTDEHNTSSDIDNHGTFYWGGGEMDGVGGGQEFRNHPGAILKYNANDTEWNMPIVNEGIFEKDFANLSVLSQPFENLAGGSFTIAAGRTLWVASSASIAQSGSTAINGVLEFRGGTHTFNTAGSFGGTGEIKFTSDLTTINAPNGWAPDIPTITQQFHINGTADIAILPTTEWFWEFGINEVAGLTNEGKIHIVTEGPQTMNVDLVNEGEIFFERGSLIAGSGHILNNTATGTIYIITDGLAKTISAPVTNHGLIEKTDDMTVPCSGTWTNEAGGTITVQNGELYFINNVLVQSGDFTITAPGMATLSGGNVELNTVAGFTGTGQLNIEDWPTINSTLGWSPGVAKVRQESQVSGTAVVTIPAGKIWEWYDGDYTLEEPLTVEGTLDIIHDVDHFSTADIENNGTVNWKEGSLNDYNGNEVVLFNNSGGLFTTAQNLGLKPCAWEINNHGTFESNNETRTDYNAYFSMHSGTLTGTAIGEIRMYDAFIWDGGDINAVIKTESSTDLLGDLDLTGGQIDFNGPTYFQSTLNLTLSGDGSIGAHGVDLEPLTGDPKETGQPSGAERMVGNIEIQSGAHILAGTNAGAFFNYGFLEKTGTGTATIDVEFNNNVSTHIEAGTLDVNGVYDLSGTFSGTGTLDLTNATPDIVYGGYAPGNSPGTLNVTGNAAFNHLYVEMEEGPPVLFDQLIVSGTVNVAGTLHISVTGNVPSGSWTIITAAAINGTFTTIDQPGCFEVEYTATSVILKKIGKLKTWTGGTGVWSDDAGWTPFGVPCPLDTVLIPSGQVTLDIQPQMAILTVTGGQVLNNVINASINAPFIVAMGATLDVAAGFTLDINGPFCNSGKISGNGTVDLQDATVAADCYGEWSPGNSIGDLTCDGTITNDIVSIEIGENGGTTGVDLLTVTENMHIEDELRLSYLGGTVPPGNRVIMECFGGPNCRTGTFDNVDYDLPLGATGINIIYEPTRVRLENTIPIDFTGTVTWLGGNGNWNDQTKWSSNSIPNDNDDVVIDDGNVSMGSTPVTVFSLALNGGALSGQQPLTVLDFLELGGGGSLSLNGGGSAGGPLSVIGPASLSSGTFALNGGGTIGQGNLTLGTNGQLTIPSGQTLTISQPSAASIASSGTGTLLTNSGTLVKSGASTFTLDVPFVNQGVTNVQNGTLKFMKPITNTAAGSYKGNGTLNFADPAATMSGPLIVSPGSSPGTLTWVSNFVGDAGSIFNYEIEENNGTVTHDLLAGANAVTVGGTLNVYFTGAPPNGEYPIIESNGMPNGAFSSVNYLPACPAPICSTAFTATGIRLVLAPALPVELASFEAFSFDKKVKLQWRTATESGVASFEPQRSTDGENWESVGLVAPAGDGYSTEPLDYFFVDEKPLPGTSLYRLKTNSSDGQAEFSEVEAVTIGTEKGHWLAFPNPVGDLLTIVAPGPAAGGLVQIFDWAGHLVFEQNLFGEKTELDLVGRPAGVYWLRLPDGEGRVLVKK